jgi:flagellar hook assembly protein FlgD
LPGEVAEAEYCFSSSVEQEFLVPLSTSLKVFPNPVSLSNTSRNDATVKVEYSLKTDYDSTEMNVYNIRGQLVKQLPINSRKGMHHINWNLKNENNKNVGSGLYFIRLSTQDERIDQRIMIIK